MKICYIDESGGAEPPNLSRSATPVMTMAAVFIDSATLPSLTRDFVSLKCRHFRAKFTSGKSLDHILTEVKGSQLLKMTRSDGRTLRRQARVFRRELLSILERHNVRIVGKVWVKKDSEGLDLKRTYGYGMQDITRDFDRYLRLGRDVGVIVADSREHASNLQVAHSIFTQKWKSGGDSYPRVQEVPIFAASDNHAGLQIADMLASTFVFPMAVAAFAQEKSERVHQPHRYEQVREEFGGRLQKLLFRYHSASGFRRGGLDVKNYASKVPAARIFGDV